MSRTTQRDGAPLRRPGEEDDICPVCKSSRYLNPNMRFLVNPECYHKMCESCVDRIFSQGPAPCPVAGCARTLRKQRFRKQTFEDIHVEREVDIRRRIASIFNLRQSDFNSLFDYNNYLEEVETMTFNLIYNVDVASTEVKLSQYAVENASSISKNASLSSQESASAAARLAADKEAARLRREEARKEENQERKEREEGKRGIVEALARGKGNADQIAKTQQKVVLKQSTARRSAMEKSRQQQVSQADNDDLFGANGSAMGTFKIKGLKDIPQVEPEKPYEPFGGMEQRREYYTLRDHYEHTWLDKARSDPQITTGGYDLREYYARTMFEAFSGLGCFIEDEIGARDLPTNKGVATAAAAVASVEGNVPFKITT